MTQKNVILNKQYQTHKWQKESVVGDTMAGESYNGGLVAEPPVGSMGTAPGQRVRWQSPLKVKAFTSMLHTNPFVAFISLDFSKAFDTVRHSTLLTKMAELDLPLPVYNWLVSFFDGHTHHTVYNGGVSSTMSISASIVQGSSLHGPRWRLPRNTQCNDRIPIWADEKEAGAGWATSKSVNLLLPAKILTQYKSQTKNCPFGKSFRPEAAADNHDTITVPKYWLQKWLPFITSENTAVSIYRA